MKSDNNEYPPCIKHALDIINKGENLPNNAKFMLATYLLADGKTVEDIMEIFKGYNEKVTRYNIEHLAGKKGSEIKYSVPSCNKLRSLDLCYAIKECDGLINPLGFGGRK